MNCVLCAESSAMFGFYINSPSRTICITCFNSIKELKHYAPNPFQTPLLTEGK
jgi:hypothetical protein